MNTLTLITLIFFLFCFGMSAALAQNEVTVRQQGSGNKATINQGTGNDTIKKTDNNCDEARLQATGQNQILVQRTGAKNDTLLYSIDKNLNLISDLLYAKELGAYQYGAGNSLFLTLPDSQKAPVRFESDQNGSGNRISARAGKTPSDISLAQKGSGNSIAINPCAEQNEERKNNSANIRQEGSGNSARITQH